MENSKEDINITVSQLIDLKKRLKKTQDSIRNENVIIGDYTYGTPTIKSYSMVKLKIGKFCSIASNVTFLLGGEHRPDYFTTYPFNIFVKDFKYIKGHPRIKGDIEVGNDVWIGHGAKILSGVKIGDGAVIGANAVVTKDVPNYAIAVGNPIKIIRYRFDEDTIKKLEEIQWWNFEESKLVRIIPFLQNNDMESLLNEIENLD